MIGRSYASRYRIEAPRRPRPHASAWKAWSLASGEPVELELLLAEICDLPDAKHRLVRLVQKLSSVVHPHVAPILDHGVDDDGGLFLTIPLVDGVPVADMIIAEGKLSVRRALHLGMAVAKGLAALHEAGVTHGSVTAQCVEIVGADGEYDAVRLRDAGLTHLLAVAPVPDARIAAIDADLPLLLAAAGGRALRRTGTEPTEDVLGLGALLFEAMTGRRYLALLDAAGPTPLARDRAVAEALEGVPPLVVDLLRSLTSARRDARLEGAAAAASAIRHTMENLDREDAVAGAHVAEDEPPPRPGMRATMLGLGPPSELDMTRAANAAARRTPSSTAPEPVAADDLVAVIDDEGDELPPDRPDRQRRETKPGVAIDSSAGEQDVGFQMPPPGAHRSKSDAAVSAVGLSPQATRHPVARMNSPEFAATAAGGLVGDPSEAARPATARVATGHLGVDVDETRAVSVPGRRGSASRRAFDDLPLPAPRRASAVRGDAGAPPTRPVATQGVGAARAPAGTDGGALDMPTLPNRRASRNEMAAAAMVEVAPGAAAPIFGVRQQEAAADAAARRPRASEGRPTYHTTDISSVAPDDALVSVRSRPTAELGEDEFNAKEPSAPSPNQVVAPAGTSLSATGAFLPWGGETEPAAGGPVGGETVGRHPMAEDAASRSDRQGPPSGALDTFFAETAAAQAPTVSATPVDDAVVFAPEPALPPAPRWPLWLAAAAIAGVALWAASEAGFLGKKAMPPREIAHEEAPMAAVVEGEAESDRHDESPESPESMGEPHAGNAQQAPTVEERAAAVAVATAPDDDPAVIEAGTDLPPQEPAPTEARIGDAALAQGEASAAATTAASADVAPSAPVADSPESPAGERQAPAAVAPAQVEPTQAAPAAAVAVPSATAARPLDAAPVVPARVAAQAASPTGGAVAVEPTTVEPALAERGPEVAPQQGAKAQAEPDVAAANEAVPAPRAPVVAATAAAPPVGMIEIPAGQYAVGCHPQLDGCAPNAMPMRTQKQAAVAFDEHEVRVDAYAACVAAGVCSSAATGPNCNAAARGRGAHPVNCVNQAQAQAFCTWRSARLPTEVEWEIAARGPTQRRYPWGSQFPSCAYATMSVLHGAGCGSNHTSAAGEPPEDVSWSGIRGLGGNVAEWTSSPYAAYRDGAPLNSTDVAVRGGSYQDGAIALPLVWQRRHLPATTQSALVGFRCAVDVVPSVRP